MSVWFGSGLFLSGFVTAVFGLVTRVVVLSEDPSDRWVAYAGLWLVLLLAPAFVVNRIGARRHPALPAVGDREAARPLLADQVRVADRNARWQVWLMVLIASVLAAFAWTDTAGRFRGGMPDLFNTAYAAGMTLVLLSVLLFAVLLGPRGWPRMRHGGPVGALGAVVGALALLLVHGAVTVLPVDATTTERRDDLAAVPASVSGVGWTWRVPEGEYVRQAAAAGAGLVVRVGDGVVAVDGETGEELWHHRRPGASTQQLFTAVDGGTVLVTFRDGRGEAGPTARFVALDAHTGQVRAQDVLPVGVLGEVHRMDLFDDGYVRYDWDGVLTGLDPDTFVRTWGFRIPEECWTEGLGSWAGGRDVVVALYECARPEGEGSGLVLVGLDPADGSEVWRHESTTSRTRAQSGDPWFGVEARTSADGAVVALFWRSRENGEQETVVLDPADGTVVAEGLDEDLPRLDHGFDDEARQPNNAFTAEGYVVPGDLTEPSVEYAWHPFDGGEPRRTAPVGAREDEGELRPGAALADMLVTSQRLESEDWNVRGGPAHITLHGAPWDGGEPWELEVGFETHEHAGLTGWPESTPLLRVPGALAIVHGGTTSVVGLV